MQVPPSTSSSNWRKPTGTNMATYKILYWQEIPSQIKADDGADEVSLSMPPRFMERIDQLAIKRGLHGADDYLSQWSWSEEEEREGSAAQVAEAVMAELEARWP
jgi:hypothetical protein